MGKFIGVYGGSFNPVHLGHLNLAQEMLEIRGLDEVWFCPASCSPHKPFEVMPSPADRLNMLNLAIADQPKFRIYEEEIWKGGLSYTIDTLSHLVALQKGKENPHSFALILGEDSAENFHTWRNPEEIVKIVPIFTGTRFQKQKIFPSFQGNSSVIAALEEGLTPIRQMEISSKEIRERLMQGLYCHHLLPRKVIDYIQVHQLYYLQTSLPNDVRGFL